MTVSVTGATGFIGRRLVHRLRSGTLLLLRVITFLTHLSFLNGVSSLLITQIITLSVS